VLLSLILQRDIVIRRARRDDMPSSMLLPPLATNCWAAALPMRFSLRHRHLKECAEKEPRHHRTPPTAPGGEGAFHTPTFH